MVSVDSPYVRIPGVVLLLVGLGITLFFAGNWYADFGTETREYRADGDVYVYEFEDLSTNESDVLRAAINGTEQTTTAPLRHFDRPEQYPTYFVVSNGTYHEVETSEEAAGDTSVSVPYQYDADRIHEFSNLSPGGQRAVEKAVANQGEVVTLQEQFPPEFESGLDAPSVGNGYYYVRYEGEYYFLFVDYGNPTGLGAGFLYWWYIIGGKTGLVLAGIGSVSAYTGRARPPIVTAAGFCVLVGLPVFAGVNPLVAAVCSVVAALVTWNLLYWYGIG